MDISEILKELRKNEGLTQQELGERLKIGQTTIAHYENGNREPHIFSLIAYADFFECSIDYLVGRSDDLGNITVKKGSTLSDDEQELLTNYRSLTEKEKMRVLAYQQILIENRK